MLCINCGGDNPADAAFCEQCGRRLEFLCPACKASVNPGARFCKKCGASLSAGQAPPELIVAKSTPAVDIPVSAQSAITDIVEGERKTVTALFADIKDSTEMMRDLDPEEALAVIDPALRIMVEAVRRYDGYVVQSTGDGIFALFGAPAAYEDHPQRALHAAIAMQQQLREYARRDHRLKPVPLEVRIGINTGEVVMRAVKTGGRI